tara:strand:+ start:1861 stop:2085 length:225 start_codon:yes stop_codon:yes gene_type:complete
MGFLMPKVPAMPAIPPVKPLATPPSYDDTARAEAAKAKRDKIRAGRTGRSATILTTAKGLEDDEYSTKKTLLGE